MVTRDQVTLTQSAIGVPTVSWTARRRLETSARPYFDLLGTPEEQKHHVVSEAGHYLPMTEVISESLDFLDRSLGPVSGG